MFLWVLSASHKNHAFVPTLNTWRQALKNRESHCLCSSDICWSPIMCVPCSWAGLHSPISERVTLFLVRYYFFPSKKIMMLWGERDFLSSSEEHGEVREVYKTMQSASRVWLSKHCFAPECNMRSMECDQLSSMLLSSHLVLQSNWWLTSFSPWSNRMMSQMIFIWTGVNKQMNKNLDLSSKLPMGGTHATPCKLSDKIKS